MNFFSSMENGRSCSRMPSDWFRMAVLDCVPSATSRLPRKVGLPGDSRCSRRHVGDHAAAGVGRLAVEQHLRAHDQVAVEQAAQADQHDGAVRGDVAELVGRARLGRDHPAVAAGVALLQLAPSSRRCASALADAPGRRLGRFGQRRLGAVVEGLQALLADVFLVGLAGRPGSSACCARCTARCWSPGTPGSAGTTRRCRPRCRLSRHEHLRPRTGRTG